MLWNLEIAPDCATQLVFVELTIAISVVGLEQRVPAICRMVVSS
jgi:hypothetical protein